MIQQVDYITTDSCNLNCSWCFNNKNDGLQFNKQTLIDSINFIVNKNLSMKYNGFLGWWFLGGEPLIHKNEIYEFNDYLNTNIRPKYPKIRLGCTTNLTLADEEFFHFCKKHDFILTLSIDGCEKAHNAHRLYSDGKGSFDKVVENLKMALEICPEKISHLRATVSPKSIPYLVESYQFLRNIIGDKDIKLTFAIAYNEDWGDNSLIIENYTKLSNWFVEEIEKADKWFDCTHLMFDNFWMEKSRRFSWCNAGKFRIAIDNNGDIWPCGKLVGSHKNYKICSIYNTDFNLEVVKNMESTCRTKKNKMCSSCYQKNCVLNCPDSYGNDNICVIQEFLYKETNRVHKLIKNNHLYYEKYIKKNNNIKYKFNVAKNRIQEFLINKL